MNKILTVFLAIVSMVLVACVSLGPSDGKNEISVSGDAEKSVSPDKAEIFLGVNTNHSSAENAQNENSRITTAVIDALKREGVAAEDIETLNYNLYPNYVWNPKTGEQEQKGYVVSNTIKITTTDFAKVGKLLQVSVDAGANQIQSVQFSLTKARENEIKKEVLAEATSSARGKAEAIAEGLGARLGSIKRVQESNVYFTPYIYGRDIALAEAKVAASAPPISPQKATVTASVTVVYEIR